VEGANIAVYTWHGAIIDVRDLSHSLQFLSLPQSFSLRHSPSQPLPLPVPVPPSAVSVTTAVSFLWVYCYSALHRYLARATRTWPARRRW
jgi:hypothetical protein